MAEDRLMGAFRPMYWLGFYSELDGESPDDSKQSDILWLW